MKKKVTDVTRRCRKILTIIVASFLMICTCVTPRSYIATQFSTSDANNNTVETTETHEKRYNLFFCVPRIQLKNALAAYSMSKEANDMENNNIGISDAIDNKNSFFEKSRELADIIKERLSEQKATQEVQTTVISETSLVDKTTTECTTTEVIEEIIVEEPPTVATIETSIETESIIITEAETVEEIQLEVVVTEEVQTESPEQPIWTGPVLTQRAGVVQGPSGKETWYNMDMSGVIKYMNDLGYYYEYWVREDGVKMFGDYVMVAANLTIRPKGTILQTSLGMGMVCDTGSFAESNTYQLDIAVNW